MAFAPGKAWLFADILAGIGLALSQQWSFLAFCVIATLPGFFFEYGLFTTEPYLGLPYIEWAKVLKL